MMVFLFIASNLASLFLGWLFGKTGRNAAVSAAAAEENGEPREGGRAASFRLIVVGLMLVAGITAVSGAWVSINQAKLADDQRRFTDCVSKQFDVLIDALDARSGSQREATKQLTEVFRTLVEAYRSGSPDSPALVQAAIEQYYRDRIAADDKLQDNPYPEPPRNACRE